LDKRRGPPPGGGVASPGAAGARRYTWFENTANLIKTNQFKFGSSRRVEIPNNLFSNPPLLACFYVYVYKHKNRLRRCRGVRRVARQPGSDGLQARGLKKTRPLTIASRTHPAFPPPPVGGRGPEGVRVIFSCAS